MLKQPMSICVNSRICYLSNLHSSLIVKNDHALSQPSGWNNKKVKTRRLSVPRGPFFKKFEKSEWTRTANNLIQSIAKMKRLNLELAGG